MAMTNAERQKAHRDRIKAKLAGQPPADAGPSLRDALVASFRSWEDNPEDVADSVLTDLEETLREFISNNISQEPDSPELAVIRQHFEKLIPIPTGEEMARRTAARAAREAEAKRAARLAKKQQAQSADA